MARRRLARNPKKRMRTKPRGRTWSRKRRRNSCEPSVIILFLISVGVILPAESNLVMLEGHEAMVGDGYAMGIAGEIAEHMMGTAEGGLGVDDPVLTEQGAQEGAEGLFVFQRLENSGEDELVLLESSF